MKKWRLLDLFSGIGGFSLAAHATGRIETAGFVEIDPDCQRVLRARFPGVPVFGDIYEVKGDEFGPVDVVAGGFPCQSFSLAGQRAGISDEDPRGDLFWQMLRLIRVLRPRWIIGENVAGIIPHIDHILDDVEDSGYAARPHIIPACGVGAPHKRERVWIVGTTDWTGRCAGSGACRSERQKPDEFEYAEGGGGVLADADGVRRVGGGPEVGVRKPDHAVAACLVEKKRNRKPNPWGNAPLFSSLERLGSIIDVAHADGAGVAERGEGDAADDEGAGGAG